MNSISKPHLWMRDSFFRVPAWRWHRADYLASSRRRLDCRIDDDWVDHAKKFRRVGARWSPADKALRAAISSAHDLWSEGLPSLRTIVESYLLTCAPLERISGICGLAPLVIEAYHELFFDVRSKRSATDWLRHHAVRWRPSGDSGTPDLGTLWKYLAATGGEEVLETAIAVTANAPLPVWITSTFKNPELDEPLFRLRTKLGICLLTASAPQAWKELASLRKRLRKLEATQVKDATGDKMLSAMVTFLAALSKHPHCVVSSVNESECHSHREVLAKTEVRLAPSALKRRELSFPLEAADAMDSPSPAFEAATPIAAETVMPIAALCPITHSWRSFDEDPDQVDGVALDRERCRVYTAEHVCRPGGHR